MPENDDASDRESRIAELMDWMIDGARPSANARDIVTGICERLVAAGVPIDRFMLFIWTLHPNMAGRRFRWIKGDGVDVAEAPTGMFATEIYVDNPLPEVVGKQVAIRRKLEDPDCPEDYIIIGELREQGLTDYLAQPLVFTTGETNACSWSSAAPGGFSEGDVAVLDRVTRPLARLTETYMLRLNAASLLSTYVGRNSGDRILSGEVHRGDGEQITAVILFVDLKGFTALSNAMSGSEIVDLLNGAFDILVPPVERAQGEILKFMGDGFLAIFPYEDDSGLRHAARRTVAAVKKAQSAISTKRNGNAVAFRTAIHFGTFHYGNIGGASRLDFTAIGPPVNYAARLLSSAEQLACDHVVSEPLANLLGDCCEFAGSVELKGFEGPQTVYQF
ncbi:MAG: adenylate/guanylate cyclase domain-containing protein [Rhizobiaceae bacterium]